MFISLKMDNMTLQVMFCYYTEPSVADVLPRFPGSPEKFPFKTTSFLTSHRILFCHRMGEKIVFRKGLIAKNTKGNIFLEPEGLHRTFRAIFTEKDLQKTKIVIDKLQEAEGTPRQIPVPGVESHLLWEEVEKYEKNRGQLGSAFGLELLFSQATATIAFLHAFADANHFKILPRMVPVKEGNNLFWLFFPSPKPRYVLSFISDLNSAEVSNEIQKDVFYNLGPLQEGFYLVAVNILNEEKASVIFYESYIEDIETTIVNGEKMESSNSVLSYNFSDQAVLYAPQNLIISTNTSKVKDQFLWESGNRLFPLHLLPHRNGLNIRNYGPLRTHFDWGPKKTFEEIRERQTSQDDILRRLQFAAEKNSEHTLF